MINIQIVEQERQAGQPVGFTILIGCTSQRSQNTQDLSRGLGSYDLICTIEARCTLSTAELDSPLDFFQGVFGCDEPNLGEPACGLPAFSSFKPQKSCCSAAGLPLAVLENA